MTGGDERSTLLQSIADTAQDYRTGEVPVPTPEHVDRWADQFDPGVQVPLLREIDHVLKNTYFSKAKVSTFLSGLVSSPKLATSETVDYWSGVNFLDIQQNGASQRALLNTFDTCLHGEVGLRIRDCGSEDGPWVYLDDALFSGRRVSNDLSAWIANEAPATATVHVIVIASHALGEWQAEEHLKKSAAAVGKTIEINVWRAVCFENRKSYRDRSEVLWPIDLPADPDVH